MNPQKQSDDQLTNVPTSQATFVVPTLDRDPAAEIMRAQINQIYDSDMSNSDSNVMVPSPYKQTHSETADHIASEQEADHWKQYHSQWQTYYQQYYERYYLAQLHTKQKKIQGHAPDQIESRSDAVPALAGEPATISRSTAVNELRSQLLTRVKQQSKRARGSKHFVPVAAAIIVAISFALLQYSSLIVATVKAYSSPGSVKPANLIVDPTIDTKVGPEPKIIIPKINVDAPVIYDVPSIQESIVQQKLENGVVHYPIPGASAFPGERGNSVILGHSSNDVFNSGNYKFIFVQLNNLEKGDTFYLNYNSVRYTYSVTEKKIIEPTQVGELVTDNSKPMATLVTCDPPGTALRRLVVMAEQISPDPDNATAVTKSDPKTDTTSIAGNAPTLFERLFGGR